jgi:hypothetical protein
MRVDRPDPADESGDVAPLVGGDGHGRGRDDRGHACYPQKREPDLKRRDGQVQMQLEDGQDDQRQRQGGGQDADTGVAEPDEQGELDRDVDGEYRPGQGQHRHESAAAERHGLGPGEEKSQPGARGDGGEEIRHGPARWAASSAAWSPSSTWRSSCSRTRAESTGKT